MNTDKHRSKKETKAKEETTKHAKIAKVFSFLCHSREGGNPFFFFSFLFLVFSFSFPCHSREGGNPFFFFSVFLFLLITDN